MPNAKIQPMAGSPRAARAKRPQMVSDAGVKYEIVHVTPAQAALWLGKNVANRRLRPAVAERYARDMGAGVWVENGAAVVFATDGTLIDGQHRLQASVDSGAPFVSLVVTNVDKHVQNTIDDGSKRTLADRFTFEGRANASTAAAVVRRVLLWQAGIRTNAGTYQPSTAEALDLLENDSTIGLAVDAAATYRSNKLLPPSIIGLGWWLFWDIDADGCQMFWEGMHTGAGLAEGSPILALRNQIIRRTGEPGRIPETLYLAWVIKAWNVFRKGGTAYHFRLGAGEKFPEPR